MTSVSDDDYNSSEATWVKSEDMYLSTETSTIP